MIVICSKSRVMGPDALSGWFFIFMILFTLVLVAMNGYLAVDFILAVFPDQAGLSSGGKRGNGEDARELGALEVHGRLCAQHPLTHCQPGH